MLYYDGMVGMVQKQERIVKEQANQNAEYKPLINEKSRQIAEGRTLSDLFKVKKPGEGEPGYSDLRNNSKSPGTGKDEKKKSE